MGRGHMLMGTNEPDASTDLSSNDVIRGNLRVALWATVVASVLVGLRFAWIGAPSLLTAVLAGVAFAVAVATPVLAVWLTRGRCPAVLRASGVALIPRVALSFSPIFLPMLWPAFACIWAAAHPQHERCHGMVRHLLGGVLLIALLVLPVVALFVSQDEFSYTTTESHDGQTVTVWHSVSNHISVAESGLSLAVSAVAILFARWLAKPSGARSTAELAHLNGPARSSERGASTPGVVRVLHDDT